MKWISGFGVKETFLISRRIAWLCIVFFLLAGLMSKFTAFYDIKWLGSIVPFVGGVSLILMAITSLMPGIMILLGAPWLARAWHRGFNPVGDSGTPWEQLSSRQKFLTYFWSLLFSGFTLVVIIGLIIQLTRG